jgi:hypothetical protein
MIGLAYSDDTVVTDISARRRELGGPFNLVNVPAILAEAVAAGTDAVYVRIASAPSQRELL